MSKTRPGLLIWRQGRFLTAPELEAAPPGVPVFEHPVVEELPSQWVVGSPDWDSNDEVTWANEGVLLQHVVYDKLEDAQAYCRFLNDLFYQEQTPSEMQLPFDNIFYDPEYPWPWDENGEEKDTDDITWDEVRAGDWTEPYQPIPLKRPVIRRTST